jgi:periplasmic protein TonB
MGLQQSAWSQPLDGESRRHRQQKERRATQLTLVKAAEIPRVVPRDYIDERAVHVPLRPRRELILLGAIAVGAHFGGAWLLAQLPPAQITAPIANPPIEVVFSAPEPPPPPPPPKVEPPKPSVVQKIVKTNVPVVPHPVAEAVESDNVVAVQEGPPPAPAPVVEEKITAARADANYLNNPPPQYPASAMRQGLQGTVHLRVLVKPDGSAGSIALEKSSGKKVLDDAALAAVQNWKFVPAKRGEQPIEGWVSFPIEFNLES